MPGRGRGGDVRGEGDNLRVRHERLIEMPGEVVAPDELEVVIEQGSSAVELEDVDVPQARVDVADPPVFTGTLPSPPDRAEEPAGHVEDVDSRIHGVRDQDAFAGVNGDGQGQCNEHRRQCPLFPHADSSSGDK